MLLHRLLMPSSYYAKSIMCSWFGVELHDMLLPDYDNDYDDCGTNNKHKY
jgi:hypothetical protein